MSHCHVSLQIGGGIREWFVRRVRKTHWSAHSFLLVGVGDFGLWGLAGVFGSLERLDVRLLS